VVIFSNCLGDVRHVEIYDSTGLQVYPYFLYYTKNKRLVCGAFSDLFNRSLGTSSTDYGKRNFKKFDLGNKRGTKIFKERRARGDYPDIAIESESTALLLG